MSLTIDWIVRAEKFPSVGVVELHADTAGGVTVTSSVHQVDPSELLGVAPAGGVGPHITVPQHVRHLEVSGDLVDTVLRAHTRLTLGNVVLSGIGLSLIIHPQEVLVRGRAVL